MAVTITHTQTRTDAVPPAASLSAPYRVVDVVTATTGGLSTSVFVFRYSDQQFDHVATVTDMQSFPAGGPTPGKDYYRLSSVTKDFADVNEAIDFGKTLIQRLTTLANEYTTVTASFTAGSPQTQTLP